MSSLTGPSTQVALVSADSMTTALSQQSKTSFSSLTASDSRSSPTSPVFSKVNQAQSSSTVTSASNTLSPHSSIADTSLSTGYYLSTETLTETITWELTVSKTVTYDDRWGNPTLTLTGPITSTETRTVTTQVIKQNAAATTPYPPWDPAPYVDWFLLGHNRSWTAPNASIAAELSSFISYGRDPACTSAYSAFNATAAFITETLADGIITTSKPGGQVTRFIEYYTVTHKPYDWDGYCCGNCG